MEKSTKSKLVNDIENRLDDFFGEWTDPPPNQASRPSIEKLKSAVLSIDWEITDDCLNDLIKETEALQPRFQNDPFTQALLRMLCGLGTYIRKRKARSHQDAIRRVMSVFKSLESVVQDHQMNEQRKKQIVGKEIIAFKKLKEQIEAQRGIATKTPAPVLEKADRSDPDTAVALTQEGFRKAVQAVEERLNQRVEALKTELAALQQELKALREG